MIHQGALTVLQRGAEDTHNNWLQKRQRQFSIFQIYTTYICVYTHRNNVCIYTHISEQCLKMCFHKYYIYTFRCIYTNVCCEPLLSKSPKLAQSTRLCLHPSGHRVQMCLLGKVPHAVLARALSQERHPGIDAKLSKRGLVKSAKTQETNKAFLVLCNIYPMQFQSSFH